MPGPSVTAPLSTSSGGGRTSLRSRVGVVRSFPTSTGTRVSLSLASRQTPPTRQRYQRQSGRILELDLGYVMPTFLGCHHKLLACRRRPSCQRTGRPLPAPRPAVVVAQRTCSSCCRPGRSPGRQRPQRPPHWPAAKASLGDKSRLQRQLADGTAHSGDRDSVTRRRPC